MLGRIVQIALGLVGAGIGFSLSFLLSRVDLVRHLLPLPGYIWYSIIGVVTLICGFLMFWLAPRLVQLTLRTVELFENTLQRTPIQDLVGGALGLIVGLIIANLFGAPLARIPWIGPYIPVVASILLGYLGLSVGLKKKEEVLGLFSLLRLGSRQGKADAPKSSSYKILDTSVIIDGRIADICKSGFLEGVLIVPRFVLEELQHIADSSDSLRRNKGRRGLDI